jgi:hypothetical protein
MNVWREKDSSITHATFPFEHERHGTLLNQIALHDSSCIVLPYSVFLVQRLESDTQNGKEHSQVPKSRTTSFIEVRISKVNQTSARLKMTFSWIIEQDKYMKARVRSWWHGSEVDWHHVGYLLKRGPTWLDDRFEPRSTLGWGERYATLLKKVKQGFETIWKRLLIINLREVVSFRVRMWFVVATRLQVWHSSLLLRTSSNMPSVLMNVAHGTFHRF